MNFLWSGIKAASALVVGGVALVAAAVGVSKLAEKALEIKQQAMDTDGMERAGMQNGETEIGEPEKVDQPAAWSGDPDDELYFYQNYSDNSYMDSAETEEVTAEPEAAVTAPAQSISSTEELKPTHTKYESGNTEGL